MSTPINIAPILVVNSTGAAVIADLDNRDCSNFSSVTVQVYGTWTGVVQVQGSNDNGVTWSPLALRDQGSATPTTWIAGATGVTANGIYRVPLTVGTVRTRFTTATTGTVQANLFYGTIHTLV